MYTEWDEERECEYYDLEPGYYEISFVESCKIPANCAMYFKTRSSLVRCGAIVHSGQFDAGFETEKMGAFLHVILPIEIEVGARVAQMIVNESYEVGLTELYDGQWQNDKQRK
jgi:deoxycytidine triphosphate deaminase